MFVGIAVNAGLWCTPPAIDWDQMPAGWQSSDMASARAKVAGRIVPTETPSQDGIRYLNQTYDILAPVLKASGYTEVNINGNRDDKNGTFGHSPYNYKNGQRGGYGPLDIYLATAPA